jgi:Trm5-related predicted tRNA methylase
VLQKIAKTDEFPYFFVDGAYWGTHTDFEESIKSKRLFGALDKMNGYYSQRTIVA